MTVQNVKAKFWVKAVQHHHMGVSGADIHADVTLAPCYGTYPGGDSEENKSFAKWTPSGEIKMSITNPAAIEFFELGKPYYIDFLPAFARCEKSLGMRRPIRSLERRSMRSRPETPSGPRARLVR